MLSEVHVPLVFGERLDPHAPITFERLDPHGIEKHGVEKRGVEEPGAEKQGVKKHGVEKHGTRIVSIRMQSGRLFEGSVFIDATYEGDLMAQAGVSYRVGREANSLYGETLDGVQVKNAIGHQFVVAVDPYVVPGKPASGLLPGIEARPPAADGTGDSRVQAYCFRICTTDVTENRIAWPKPADYDPRRYELLLRNFEAGDHRVPWMPDFDPQPQDRHEQ